MSNIHSVDLSERAARYYSQHAGKPVANMGAIVVNDPNGGTRFLPIFRGIGASDEPYPHDPTLHELRTREAARLAERYEPHGLGQRVAMETTIYRQLIQRGWEPE